MDLICLRTGYKKEKNALKLLKLQLNSVKRMTAGLSNRKM